MSTYVYAFAADTVDIDQVGLHGNPVRWLDVNGVKVAVSDAPAGKLRPERRLLAAHQRVLAAIAAHTTALPASFGLIAESDDELADVIGAGTEALLEELESVQGCVEMSVALRWDADNVFSHLVDLDPQLEALRDQLIELGNTAPHDLKVEVGRRVEAVLARERAAHAQGMTYTLESVCRDIKENAPRTEAELFNAACLIGRDRIGEFEAAIEAAAANLDDSFIFSIGGPFPPHHFVDLRIDMPQLA